MTKTQLAKSAGLALLGGATAAIATAIPLVDDGLMVSEALSIALAGLVGTGLTAAPSALGAGVSTRVGAGDSTGNSTGPHLHFETKED